jgi:hypothetical protein
MARFRRDLDDGKWTRRRWLEVLSGSAILATVSPVAARAQTAGAITTVDQLLALNQVQIESIYRQGTVAGLPAGRVRGTAILSPGTSRARLLSRGARLVWQGKIIDPADASAVNRFFGLKMIRAQVYQGQSWLDGGPSLILDYSQTSKIYAANRDEIRLVAPGLYLGLMYARTTPYPSLSLVFALEAHA